MRIHCGVPVYAQNEHVGNVRGVRVDAVNDRVTGIGLGSNEPGSECSEIELKRISASDENSIRCGEPASRAITSLPVSCGEEDVRMTHWLNSLVPDTGWETADLSARYVTFSERDRGEFTLVGSRDVGIESCGHGVLESIEVDAQGYIDSVLVRVDERTGATVPMKPVMKRSRESIVETARAGLRSA